MEEVVARAIASETAWESSILFSLTSGESSLRILVATSEFSVSLESAFVESPADSKEMVWAMILEASGQLRIEAAGTLGVDDELRLPVGLGVASARAIGTPERSVRSVRRVSVAGRVPENG